MRGLITEFSNSILWFSGTYSRGHKWHLWVSGILSSVKSGKDGC